MTPSCPFRWGAATDTGKVRQINEDAFMVEPEIGLFLVSDGMGGHRGGQLASNMVVEDMPVKIEVGLDKLRTRSERSVRTLLKRIVAEQSRQVQMEGDSESGYADMGATMAMALVREGRVYLVNLGDSRIYRYRQKQLRQLNKDHSVIAELLELGQLRPDDAEDHSAQGQITQYIGMTEETQPFLRSFIPKEADGLLLCTDGLTDMVSERQICDIMRHGEEPQATCRRLVDAANAAGGLDNVTALVVEWPGG